MSYMPVDDPDLETIESIIASYPRRSIEGRLAHVAREAINRTTAAEKRAEEAEAQAGAMREALEAANGVLKYLHSDYHLIQAPIERARAATQTALASDAGRSAQERMAKLEDVLSFCKEKWPLTHSLTDCTCDGCQLARMVAELEAKK